MPVSSDTRSGAPSARRWRWPTTSSSARGPHAGGERSVLRQVDAQAGAEEIFLHARILPVPAAGIG